MRLVIQRVKHATVTVAGVETARIGQGLLTLVGFAAEDAGALADGRCALNSPHWKRLEAVLEKMLALRIFPDTQDRMNNSLMDCQGELLLVSQFTLLADCTRGRRPSFQAACPPEPASLLFDAFYAAAARQLPGKTGKGIFGAHMDIALTNWGPVTIILESSSV